MTTESMMEFFGKAGFKFWATGGGCTAFGRNLDDGKTYVLVTHEDGGFLPIEGQPIMIGLYDDGDHYDGVTEIVATKEEAVTKLNALIAKHLA